MATCKACGVEKAKFMSDLCENCNDNPAASNSEGASPPAAMAFGPEASPSTARLNVNLIDIEIPFWDLVVFLIKLSIAAIPATIVLSIIWAIVAGALSLLF